MKIITIQKKKRRHRVRVHHLRLTCPICGSVSLLGVTMAQLRALYVQDTPLYEIFQDREPVEVLPLLGGICPACWAGITRQALTADGDDRPVPDASLVESIMSRAAHPKDRETGMLGKRAIAVKSGRMDIPEDVRERLKYYRREAALAGGLPDPYGGREIGWFPKTPMEMINPFMLPEETGNDKE